ncbi:MAG: tyrosine-type recombinase/integrase [bacterium]|nr:tyrosine-type recombinase/integrase [bacterium]
MSEKKDDRLKNIIKISEGVYEIQISNGYREDGKRDRITETVRGTEEDAIARRDEIKKELKENKSKGIKTSNGGYNFLEVAKMFLQDRDYSKKTGTTINGYKIHLNNHILPEFGFKKIRKIEESDLENLYKKMRDKGLRETTIKHSHTLIGTIFNYAIFKKWVTYNPAFHVRNKPKSDTKKRNYYDHDEIEQALECLEKLPTHKNGMNDRILHSQNLRLKTAITLLFNSGLRREELIGLKWIDIKVKTGVLSLDRAVVTVGEENFAEEDIIERLPNNLVCKKLKNDASYRDIHVPSVCIDLLLEYKKDQINCGYDINDNDFVFQNVRYKCIWNPNNLTDEWKKFRKKFNLRYITVHDIRHSHATDLLSMGVPIQDVSRRLGHSDVATTLRIYTHSNLGQDKLIAEKLEKNYENRYVSNILNFKVVTSIIIGINIASEEEVTKAVQYITGEKLTEQNHKSLIETCRNYILEKYNYLENINLFIDSNTTDTVKEAFLNIMSNVRMDVCKIRPMYL